MPDAEDRIPLARRLADDDSPEDAVDGFPNLGPGEHDRDPMDGSWEDRYYRGQIRTRDWQSINLAIGLLVVLGLLVPAVLVFTR